MVMVLFSLLSSFWINKSRLMKSPCCLAVCVSPLTSFECLKQSIRKLHIYHGTWAHLKSRIHKSILSVTPNLKHLNFLRQNIHIAWTPVPVFMQLDMYQYIMPHKFISKMQFINPFD
jgi:hypothetical protein